MKKYSEFWVFETHHPAPTIVYLSAQRKCGVVANMLNCYIIVNEFKFQSSNYIHFQANTRGKCMNSLILPAMG